MPYPDGAPAAYLNYVFLDENNNYVAAFSGFKSISSVAAGSFELLQPGDLIFNRQGHLYVYVSNETNENVSVYFDDLKITHRKSKIVQKDDYYPFGLTFNSYQRPGQTEQKYLFAGKERQDDLGLSWYDFGTRMFAPDIARWNGIDASAENYVNQSPYHYAGNNPILLVDYDGNDYGVSVNHDSKTITVNATYLASSKNQNAVRKATNKFNSQSGKFVYVVGGKQAIKNGGADAYKVNYNLTTDVANGDHTFVDQGSGNTIVAGSQGDLAVSNDETGTLNSVNSIPNGTLGKKEGKKISGSTTNDVVNVEESAMNGNVTAHEIGHTLGLSHTGGLMSDTDGAGSLNANQVQETLAGAGIGGDNKTRNSTGDTSSLGDGTLQGQGNNTVGQGKVMSVRKYNRLVKRFERKNK